MAVASHVTEIHSRNLAGFIIRSLQPQIPYTRTKWLDCPCCHVLQALSQGGTRGLRRRVGHGEALAINIMALAPPVARLAGATTQ